MKLLELGGWKCWWGERAGVAESLLNCKRQTKCMVDICGCFAIQAAGVMSAMR
jgi:hypothetical protein